MKGLVALAVMALLAVPLSPAVLPQAAFAQSNDNDFTPLNSRIRRERQFPLEPRSVFNPGQMSSVGRKRSRNMADQFARCLWSRSNEKGYDLLARTDYGFVNFQQIGLGGNRVMELYPIRTCLSRVANTQNSGVSLRYTADAMRRWYLQAAYLDLYADGPSWYVPGNAVAERTYPLSATNFSVRVLMDFTDCVVTEDPHAADFYFRTTPDSDEEGAAIQQVMPALGTCLPAGQELELDPAMLRIWLGESLWHAARNSAPASADAAEESE